VVALENGLALSRLGLTVGRRVGGAVQRNRAKRLLRECFRLQAGPSPAADLVLLAKPALRGRRLDEVEREYRERLAELARRRARPRRNPAPRSD
jgi:ribonuclease P protein component